MESSEKKIILNKGMKYSICTCGASLKIPFCDESHKKLNEEKNCSYKSLKITPEEDVTLTLNSKAWEKDS